MKDVIIIGTGAAGYTAAIYAQRYGLKPLLIGETPGGTAVNAFKIENYPGFPSITGIELMDKFRAHAEGLKVEIVDMKVDKIEPKGDSFVVATSDGNTHEAKTVVLALGTVRRKLGVPGEKELDGKGVAYCATCDAPFFKDKTVAVVGGSDAATMAAMLLTQYAPQVYIIARGDHLKGEPIWIKRVEKSNQVEVILNTNVTKVNGDKMVESIELDKPYQGKDKLELQGVFIEIGAEPASELAEQLNLDLNEGKRIKVDNLQATSLPGVYAAGDITNKTGRFEQIINSAYQGAQAAYSAFQYLEDRK
ncbi:NAD(P)/FAD-dependent oxidoreductase [Patescibacteria group bacterium]